MSERKTKRRTRERVLETALRLFNSFGEPNVTTNTIAADMGISPGNLYYHFRNKDEITNDIFAAFEREIGTLLGTPSERAANVEDIWLFLHLLFETIWKYRFLYRDLSDLLSRNRFLEMHFKQILEHQIETTLVLCQSLASDDEGQTHRDELRTLATNMMVVATYWLSFAYVSNPRNFVEGEVLGQGAYQVMSLVAPYLQGQSRTLFARLAAEYRQR